MRRFFWIGSDACRNISAGKVTDYADGDRKVIDCGESEVGIFKIDGEFFAWHNRCAHRAGPVCQGRIMKRVIEPVADDRTDSRAGNTTNPRPTSCVPGTDTNTASRPDATRATAAIRLRKAETDDQGRRNLCSDLKRDRKNDRYGWIDAAAPELLRASRELVENNEAGRVSDRGRSADTDRGHSSLCRKIRRRRKNVSADRRRTRQRNDADRAVVGGFRNAARAASRPDGAGALVSAPSGRGHLFREEKDHEHSRQDRSAIFGDTADRRPYRYPRHPRACQAQRASGAACRTGSCAISMPTMSRRCPGKRWSTYIEDPVVRDNAMRFQAERLGAPPYGLNGDLGLRYQSVGGRIPHQDGQREIVEETDVHRDVTLTRRAMDSLGIDNMVVFPTPMLFLGMHPQPEMEVWLGGAYNRWLIDRILSGDDRIKSLIYLPFNTPQGSRADGRGARRQKGRDRLLRDQHPLQAGASQRLHAALFDDRGDAASRWRSRRLSLAGSVACDRQPVSRHARAGLRLEQHDPYDELDPERNPRAVSRSSRRCGWKADWPGCPS